MGGKYILSLPQLNFKVHIAVIHKSHLEQRSSVLLELLYGSTSGLISIDTEHL